MNPKEKNEKSMELLKKLIELLLRIRNEARSDKNFKLADEIHDELNAVGIEIKDNKDGTSTYKIKDEKQD